MSAHRSPRAPRRLIASGALALTLVLATSACSSDDEGKVVADVLEDDDLPTTLAPEDAAGEECVAPVDPTEFEGKPEVEMPVGETIDELETEDITVGDGAEAVDGKALKLNYVGVACSTGVEFDTSWKEGGMPIDVTLGAGGVIPGWDQGIVGMKAGGVRKLSIPSDLAYGPEGRPPTIIANEALVFVVELVEVNDAPAEGETTTVPAEGGEETTTTVAEEGGEETTTTAAAEDATTTTAAE